MVICYFYWNIDWPISILFRDANREMTWSIVLVSVVRNLIKLESRHLIGYTLLQKRHHKAAMVVVSQQIFDKRHNVVLLKCYNLRPFHQILKLQTQSGKNLPWIYLFKTIDRNWTKKFWYNYTTYISQSNDASNDFVIYLQFALFL